MVKDIYASSCRIPRFDIFLKIIKRVQSKSFGPFGDLKKSSPGSVRRGPDSVINDFLNWGNDPI